MSSPGDRYEPLPGLLSIPAFLIRRLGPRGRIALAVIAALALVAAVVGALTLVPRITESKRENAERERREAAAHLVARRRALIAEQRPHHGRSEAGSSRANVLGDLESGILADARARTAAGKLGRPPASRVECDPLGHGQDPSGARVRYDCIAVTSDLPASETTPAGVVGHTFAAVVHYDSDRFTWCKVSGRPGEQAITAKFLVKLPRECGG